MDLAQTHGSPKRPPSEERRKAGWVIKLIAVGQPLGEKLDGKLLIGSDVEGTEQPLITRGRKRQKFVEVL
jgi:hypothetical protein